MDKKGKLTNLKNIKFFKDTKGVYFFLKGTKKKIYIKELSKLKKPIKREIKKPKFNRIDNIQTNKKKGEKSFKFADDKKKPKKSDKSINVNVNFPNEITLRTLPLKEQNKAKERAVELKLEEIKTNQNIKRQEAELKKQEEEKKKPKVLFLKKRGWSKDQLKNLNEKELEILYEYERESNPREAKKIDEEIDLQLLKDDERKELEREREDIIEALSIYLKKPKTVLENYDTDRLRTELEKVNKKNEEKDKKRVRFETENKDFINKEKNHYIELLYDSGLYNPKDEKKLRNYSLEKLQDMVYEAYDEPDIIEEDEIKVNKKPNKSISDSKKRDLYLARISMLEENYKKSDWKNFTTKELEEHLANIDDEDYFNLKRRKGNKELKALVEENEDIGDAGLSEEEDDENAGIEADAEYLRSIGGDGHDSVDKNGLSNVQIDEIMKIYPEYLGTIAHNEMKDKILPFVKPRSRGCFIINTDPKSKNGEHWQAIYFDARPGKEASKSIEFFDSFGDPIDDRLLSDVKKLSEKLNSHTYLKFKENRICLQDDKSSNCGFFCIKFLIDRLREKQFAEVTNYNIQQGEGEINNFKTQLGFGYLSSFGREDQGKYLQGSGILDTIRDVGKRVYNAGKEILSGVKYRDTFGPDVRQYLVPPKGDIVINTIKICRKPIASMIDKAINIISLGFWNQKKKELGYSDLFHLYLSINDNIMLERNHVVEIRNKGIESGSEIVNVDYPLGNKLSMSQLLNNTSNRVGPSLQKYDPADNNCQVFIKQVLESNNLWNEKYRSFVFQDAKSLISSLPQFTQTIMKGITNIAHKGDILLKGRNRNKKLKLNK